MYTIKCDAVNFKLSNSHKKVIKNFNRLAFRISKIFINKDISRNSGN